MKKFAALTALFAAQVTFLAPQVQAFVHVEEGMLSPEQEEMVHKLVDNHNIKVPTDLYLSIEELRAKHFAKKGHGMLK